MKQPSPVVFIVDDDDAVRNSLRLLIRSVGLSASTFQSAQEFLASYGPALPGCVILDVRMPAMSGIELQHQLNLRGAVIPVIFISGHADIPMAVEAMQQGAFDFLQKPLRDQALIERVQRALEKDQDNRAELSQRARILERMESLTPRERDILNLVTSGKPNKAMAADLELSQRTVDIHRAHVMEKMGASPLAQLVRMVMDIHDTSNSIQ